MRGRPGQGHPCMLYPADCVACGLCTAKPSPSAPPPRLLRRLTAGHAGPRRYHQYKFIVDGEWRHDEMQPFMPDPLGNVNNWLFVRRPEPQPHALPQQQQQPVPGCVKCPPSAWWFSPMSYVVLPVTGGMPTAAASLKL